MPKGRTTRAKLGRGEFQQPGGHVDELRAKFVSGLRLLAEDAVAELSSVVSRAQASEWAQRHHVLADWVVDVVMETVSEWSQCEAASRHRELSIPVSGDWIPEPEHITWAPTFETEAEFRERVERYIARVTVWAMMPPSEGGIGLVNTVERRGLIATDDCPFGRDMHAFLHFQVCGWDFDAVMEEYFPEHKTTDAAWKALRQLASDLQIPIRK